MNLNINTVRTLFNNSDMLGATASMLCVVHCLLTPFLFAAQATLLSTCSDISPTWWRMIDFIFLIITFFAIRFTVNSTSFKWLPSALYSLWSILAILTFNKFFHFIQLPHLLIYIAAIGLSILHLYNFQHSHFSKSAVTKN